MNCKPGDLAYVKKVGPFYGAIIKVTVVEYIYMGRPIWGYEKPLLKLKDGSVQEGFFDDVLRPIRPGGITDEEVRDLYTPNRDEVTA